MLLVSDEVRSAYKADSTFKSTFVVFRDLGVMKQSREIYSESLGVTESICSSGDFKVGLCEASTARISMELEENVKGDEMTLFQTIGEFIPTVEYDDTKGIQISGSGVTEVYSDEIDGVIGDATAYFDPTKNYLAFLNLDYEGEIYLYLQTAANKEKMIYYLAGGLNIGETVQVVLPIPGSNFGDYKFAIYSKDTLSGYATIYEVSVPVMPLGIYSIDSCKKENNTAIRDITGYDRMATDVMDESVTYELSQSTLVSDILEEAADGTQLLIGNNLINGDVSYEMTATSESSVSLPTPMYVTPRSGSGSCQGSYVSSGTEYLFQKTDSAVQVDKSMIDRSTQEVYHMPPEAYYSITFCVEESQLSNFTNRTVDNESFYVETQGSYSYLGINYRILKIRYTYNDMWGYLYCIKGNVTENTIDVYAREGRTDIGNRTIATGYASWQIYYSVSFYYGLNFNPALPRGKYSYTDTYNYSNPYADAYYEEARIPEIKSGLTRAWTQGNVIYNETIKKTTATYQIDNYDPNDDLIVHLINPEYNNISLQEEALLEDAESYGTLTTNNRSSLLTAIANNSTYPVTINNDGTFTVSYISSLTYSGEKEGTFYFNNPVIGVSKDNLAEVFIDMLIAPGNAKITGTKRNIMAAYLEMNGYFLRFDRYGVSEFLKVDVGYKTELFPSSDLELLESQEEQVGLVTMTPDDLTVVTTGTETASITNPIYKVDAVPVETYRQDGTYTETLHDYTAPEGEIRVSLSYHIRTPGDDGDFFLVRSDIDVYGSVYDASGNSYGIYLNWQTVTIDGVTYRAWDANGDRGGRYTWYLYTTDHRVPRLNNQSAVSRWQITGFADGAPYVVLWQSAFTYGYIWGSEPGGTGWVRGEMQYVDSSDPSLGAYYTWTRYADAVWNETITTETTVYEIPEYDFTHEYSFNLQSGVQTLADGDTALRNAALALGTLSVDRHITVAAYLADYPETTQPTIDGNGRFEITYVKSLSWQKIVDGSTVDSGIYNAGNLLKSVTDGITSGIVYGNANFSIRENVKVATNKYGIRNYSDANTYELTFDPSKTQILAFENNVRNDALTGGTLTTDRQTDARATINGIEVTNTASLNPDGTIDVTFISKLESIRTEGGVEFESTYYADNPIRSYTCTSSTSEPIEASDVRSIYVEDDTQEPFDGICIKKSNPSSSETYYPFYYNKDGTTVYNPDGHYYVISGNFFVDNFVLTAQQLTDICEYIIANIGNLAFFNLDATIRALPYVETGDTMDIQTPDARYKAAVLRRTMSGCVAMMDNLEADFSGNN